MENLYFECCAKNVEHSQVYSMAKYNVVIQDDDDGKRSSWSRKPSFVMD